MDRPFAPQPDISEEEADKRLASDKADIRAMLAKADHLFLRDDLRAATSFYNAALVLFQNGAVLPEIEIRRAAYASQWLNSQFGQIMLDALDKAGLTKSVRHPRFQKSLEIMLGQRPRDPVRERYPSMPQSYFYPDLSYIQFADTKRLSWVGQMEEATSFILDEASALIGDDGLFKPYVQQLSQRPQGDVHAMLEKLDWNTCYLFENGAPVGEHVKRCPELYSAVTSHAPLCHITTRAPSVMLSLLRPGAHIPPHTGMINCRWVCHLPLIIPDNCGFRVGSETRAWEEGKILVFDDSVEHEAWNKGKENRLVLIFDVWHPELEKTEQEQIACLFGIVDQA